MDFVKTTYCGGSEKNKYQHVESLVKQIQENSRTQLESKFTTPEQKAIVEISLEVSTTVLLEFLKNRVDHGEDF